jgi:hypothetical protein
VLVLVFVFIRVHSFVVSRCNQALLNDDGMSALGLLFHVDCFACLHCEVPFRDEPYYVRNEKPYCKSDYLTLFAKSVCAGCMGAFKKGDVAMEAVNKVLDRSSIADVTSVRHQTTDGCALALS